LFFTALTSYFGWNIEIDTILWINANIRFWKIYRLFNSTITFGFIT
jgi:hypothetical protein